ncbi:MAG: hypothetical protein ACRD2D_00245, partial [Terriglobales bacterium]
TDTDEHLVNAHGLGGGGFPADYSSIDSLVTSAESTTTTFVRKPPTSTFDDLVVYKSALWTLNNLPKSIPTITGVTPPNNGVYGTGQVLTFTVTFSAAVSVNTTGGTPYLSFSAITGGVGTSNLAKAMYQSGSGTTTLTFSYTVTASDFAPVGLTMTSSITLNGGSIGSCPLLTFTAPSLTGVIIEGYIYVADVSNCRVQMFNPSGSYMSQFGTCGTGNGQFSDYYSYPIFLATDASGNVWVSDWGNSRLEQFNSTGTYLTQISSHLSRPAGIAIDPSGNIWVADTYYGYVSEFNSSGTYLGQVGSTGSANGQFGYLAGIAADAGGNIWVADEYNYRVQEFNNSGTWLQSIGGPPPYTCETSPASSHPACAAGSGNGQFNTPYNLVFDASGNAWVNDYGNSRLEEFNASGTYLGQFGSWGSGGGTWRGPDGFATDADGNFWIADNGDVLIEKFNSSGTYLGQFGSSGSGNGQFGAAGPSGIATGR